MLEIVQKQWSGYLSRGAHLHLLLPATVRITRMNKSKLQELCHQHSWPLPSYDTVREGPDHDPRFTSTVTVNGLHFQTAAFSCRSSKEAQSQAAKLAYDHFTAPKTILQRPNQPEASAAGFSTSDAELNIKTSVSGILPPTKLEGQNFQTNQTSLNHEVDPVTKGNLYKNRLQNYAQKRNLSLPMYSYEIDGPPHVRRFKARVTINGNTHEAPAFCSTIKDAENAAAKVAFEALPPDAIQEDEGLYKSLLQELALKMGFRFPVYETSKSGPPHMPVFLSSVEVGDRSFSFQGHEAKTKKQAEMSAAKVAYAGLTKDKAERNGTSGSEVCQTKGGASVVSSSNLKSTVINKKLQDTMSIPNEMQGGIKGNAGLSNEGEQVEKCEVSGLATEKDATFSSRSYIVGAPLMKYSSLQTTVTKELQQQARPNVSDKLELHVKSTDNFSVQEELAEKSEEPHIAKRQNSPSPDGHLRSPSESSTTKPDRLKIVVRPCKPNETYTDGPVVCNDQKWVAMRVGMDQDQQ